VRAPIARLLALALLGLLSACSHSGSRGLASLEGAEFRNHDPEGEIEAIQATIEEALVWRVKAAQFYRDLRDKSGGGSLSADDLDQLYRGAESYFDLRDRLLPHATSYLVAFAAQGAEPPLGSATGRLMMKQIKLNLAVALVLYDNYMVGIYPYYADAKFRRLLRRDRASLSGRIADITKSYLDPKQRQYTAYGITWVLKERELGAPAPDNEDVDLAGYLDALIAQSPSFTYLQDDYDSRSTVTAIIRRISDDFAFVRRMFTYVTSQVFGNTIGLVETRKGYLLRLPQPERAAIAASMEPLDVVLEKTPFRLTDRFIPGHYGHVAVWVGSEAQLTRLGVWNDPAVVPYQAMIRDGHSMVEALRPGVQISTLEQFLNIDDLLVVRHTNLTDAERREYVLNAFHQIGKDYDFNFDVETDRRIVCSELAYVVFKREEWPTSRALGRYTISPDNVAVKALSRNPFTPVLMYYDGHRIDARLEETLDRLLARDYAKVREMHGLVRRVPEPEDDVSAPTRP
jgi:Permuted papain-like amidase enzyme, YaeF/YiiX, C92 family